MESEIEKLRKLREEEIRQDEAAALDRLEEQWLKIAPNVLAFIGFIQGCSKYIHWADNDRFLKDLGHSFFSFFYFLIGAGLGWLIGWLLVKGVFAIIRSSK